MPQDELKRGRAGRGEKNIAARRAVHDLSLVLRRLEDITEDLHGQLDLDVLVGGSTLVFWERIIREVHSVLENDHGTH